MGSRASFAVKRNGKTKVYGSRRAGSSTVNWLLQGPEKASAKFASIDEMDELDDMLGGDDGSAVIDWDTKSVVWIMSNARLPVHQRLCNRMISQAFDGWDVRMAHDTYETAAAAGVKIEKYFEDEPEGEERDWGDYSEEEIAEHLADEEAAKHTTTDDLWLPDKVPDKIDSIHQFETGSWITIRLEDGSLKDYFGFGELHNHLLKGEQLATDLAKLQSIDHIPHELVTLEGMMIDWKEKTLWRWNISPVAQLEDAFTKSWKGWTVKQVPGGNWAGQVELSGREPGGLACSEREVLGLVVSDMVPVHGADSSGLAGLVFKARLGCLGITLLLGAAAIGLYFANESTTGAVVLGLMFAIGAFLTYQVFSKTAKIMGAFDLADKPSDLCAMMDKILVGLNYPTIQELKASGEISDVDDDLYDEDDEE